MAGRTSSCTSSTSRLGSRSRTSKVTSGPSTVSASLLTASCTPAAVRTGPSDSGRQMSVRSEQQFRGDELRVLRVQCRQDVRPLEVRGQRQRRGNLSQGGHPQLEARPEDTSYSYYQVNCQPSSRTDHSLCWYFSVSYTTAELLQL